MDDIGAPAGWYADGSGRIRWFDGKKWTDHYLDDHRSAPPPPPRTTYHPKMDTAAAPELQPKKDGFAWGCIGCITIPVLVLVLTTLSGAFSNNDDSDDYNNRYTAIRQCEERVKSLLKAPSTAKFNSDASGDWTWKVTGTVDAENSFGAMIRSVFQCTVKITGNTATTSIDYLE